MTVSKASCVRRQRSSLWIVSYYLIMGTILHEVQVWSIKTVENTLHLKNFLQSNQGFIHSDGIPFSLSKRLVQEILLSHRMFLESKGFLISNYKFAKQIPAKHQERIINIGRKVGGVSCTTLRGEPHFSPKFVCTFVISFFLLDRSLQVNKTINIVKTPLFVFWSRTLVLVSCHVKGYFFFLAREPRALIPDREPPSSNSKRTL